MRLVRFTNQGKTVYIDAEKILVIIQRIPRGSDVYCENDPGCTNVDQSPEEVKEMLESALL